ncbi:Acyltransferase 3 [Polaromonas sp. CG9_12]|nr:Acyltransferase 3 [Polaromonas sp. CG9_12]
MGRPVHLRQPGIDALKGLACLLIIWHHLAFYGPMSDVVYPFAPDLTGWLYDYGRMAVQVFLVVGGFLAARSLAPQGQATYASPGRLLARRYRRLVLPYVVAVAASVAVAALVRPWFVHPSVPSEATLFQLLAHGLLLQDMLEFEGLSAGVWYVAIDFQLFAMSVLLFSLSRRLERRWPGLRAWPVAPGLMLTVIVCAASLFLFNNDSRWDMAGVYFFGAYGLGMLAFWAGNSNRWASWLLFIGLLAGTALLLDFRGRLLVALAVAFGLVFLQRYASGTGVPRWPQRQLAGLGKISYSVFLIHFPVCLLVNAVVSYFWPAHLLANVAGLLAAFALSVGAGSVLYRNVESRASLYSGRLKFRFVA